MICPDCNGSKMYTPLVGPIEDCKACCGTGFTNQTDASGLQDQVAAEEFIMARPVIGACPQTMSKKIARYRLSNGDITQEEYDAVPEDCDATWAVAAETRGSCEPLYGFARQSLDEPLSDGQKYELKTAIERSWQTVPANPDAVIMYASPPMTDKSRTALKKDVLLVASQVAVEKLGDDCAIAVSLSESGSSWACELTLGSGVDAVTAKAWLNPEFLGSTHIAKSLIKWHIMKTLDSALAANPS